MSSSRSFCAHRRRGLILSCTWRQPKRPGNIQVSFICKGKDERGYLSQLLHAEEPVKSHVFIIYFWEYGFCFVAFFSCVLPHPSLFFFFLTGKFWFDRQPVRTNFPFSGTDCNPAERERLWNNVAAYCSFDYSP